MRVAVVFGQFGAAADPVNLPAFRDRLNQAGFETILVQHTDVQQVFDFLDGYSGSRGVVGASLGAGIAPIMAGYLRLKPVRFVGGFQPSDYDPVMHTVSIPLRHDNEPLPYDIITRAVTVPSNVIHALCFRNPVLAGTGGLGHAAYVRDDDNKVTDLRIIERADVHPGDFGEAADIMFEKVMEVMR